MVDRNLGAWLRSPETGARMGGPVGGASVKGLTASQSYDASVDIRINITMGVWPQVKKTYDVSSEVSMTSKDSSTLRCY
jgi:hypothetical protein